MITLGVDGNWVLYRAFFMQKHESSNPAAAIARRFVSMICKDALLVKATQMLVAFDGNRVFRYDLYPGYKANRGSGPSPYDYLGGLLEYLAFCGIESLQLSKYEADDVLCSMAASVKGNLVISSRDKDSYQYVKPNISLFDSSAKPEPKRLRYADIEAIAGVRPELCLDLQTLIGDRVDNVPSLMSRAKAIAGLKKWGSLQQWLKNDQQLHPLKEQLKLNRKLVKLVSSIAVEAKVPNWNKDKDMTTSYTMWRDFCNPRSKGLF